MLPAVLNPKSAQLSHDDPIGLLTKGIPAKEKIASALHDKAEGLDKSTLRLMRELRDLQRVRQ